MSPGLIHTGPMKAMSSAEYELYTVLENRVKEAMLSGNEWVSIKDLKIRRDTYDIWESKHIKQ